MSLILEALRKSEAERRRGQTPDLLTDVAPVAPSTRATTQDRRAWAVLGIAAVITVLLVLWWLRPVSQAEPATQAVATTARAAPSARPSPSDAAATTLPLRPPATPPPHRASPSPTVAASASAEPAHATASLPASALPPPPPASEPAAPRPVATAKLPEPPAAASVFSSPDVPLRLADLSSEDRQQLPALKLSMHMWAPVAADRFVIIDGTRVNEGDRVGDAVVEAIQTDGVMLSWHGRRIRLPIR
ncbi:general secretion pathway protein GspB [Lysobacter terrae]